MSKHRVLSVKLGIEWRGHDGQNETERPDHSASLGDSITSSTRIRFSVHTALDQLQARTLIEGEIAALAAKNASPEQLEALDATLETMHQALSDPVRFLDADHAFHVAIAMASGNQVLLDQLEHLWALRYQPTFRKFEEHFSNDRKERTAVLKDHRSIAAAIRSGKPAEARAALKQHLKRVQDIFTK